MNTPPPITRDVAYACFLIVGVGGLVTLFGSLLELSFADANMELGFWLYVTLAIVLFVGFGLSIALWQHVKMRVLALSTIVFLGTGMLHDIWLPTIVVDTFGVLYGVIITVLSARWFLIERPRLE